MTTDDRAKEYRRQDGVTWQQTRRDFEQAAQRGEHVHLVSVTGIVRHNCPPNCPQRRWKEQAT